MKLYVTVGTVFKKNSTLPSSQIPDGLKLEVAARRQFDVLGFRDAGKNHLAVTFAQQIGPQKWNTWCVYKGHVVLQPDDIPKEDEHFHVSNAGLSLIKKFEGFRGKAYKCPAGIWTIGYGSTHSVVQGQTITEPEASERLRREVQIYERGVLNCLSVKPTQNQFDALVSLCYNIGVTAIARSSVIKHHNRSNFTSAADAFLLWNKGGGQVLPGLTRRRREERELYLKQ